MQRRFLLLVLHIDDGHLLLLPHGLVAVVAAKRLNPAQEQFRRGGMPSLARQMQRRVHIGIDGAYVGFPL